MLGRPKGIYDLYIEKPLKPGDFLVVCAKKRCGFKYYHTVKPGDVQYRTCAVCGGKDAKYFKQSPRDYTSMTPEEIFGRAYDVLVKCAQAPEGHWREDFIRVFTDPTHRAMEWRFGGVFGFGGKFWRNDHYYVSMYREDETEKKVKLRDLINIELMKLPYWEPSPV